ncbi:MAG: phosphate ABC transporter ATP-binding protein [bacterium]
MPEQVMTRPKIAVRDLTVSYGGVPAVRGVTFDVRPNEIMALIGPARSGKTTLLRCLNRLDAGLGSLSIAGAITLNGADILAPGADLALLRRTVGMVFATPLPLPGSVFENVALGLTFSGVTDRATVAARVEEGLRASFLWDEVKDRLEDSVFTLSGGQQQRLCVARTLALRPEVLLLDEPCSALDPISTARIEEALERLKPSCTIVLVTNLTAQAARVSDRTAMILNGELIECEETATLFTNPRDKRTEDYITGRFG